MIMPLPETKRETYYQASMVDKPYAVEVLRYKNQLGKVTWDIHIYHEDLPKMADEYFERDFKNAKECLNFITAKLDVYAASKKCGLKQTIKDRGLLQDWFLFNFNY